MKDVTFALLHQAVLFQNTGRSESNLQDSKIRGIKMQYDALGLHVALEGKKFLIPAANVAIVTLSEDSADKTKK